MRFLLVFLTFSLFLYQSLMSFDKVVIWGHKLHTHTHSYIHSGFYTAFGRLDYPTYWFNNDEDVSEFDFSNTLFISEGNVNEKMPLRQDCLYLIHNPVLSAKYEGLKCAYFQVYTDDVLSLPNLLQVDRCIYYDISGKCVYMPWATDLFPDEIDQIKSNLTSVQKQSVVYWIGTIGEGQFGNHNEVSPFALACKENDIEFTSPNPWATGISIEEHRRMIGISYMAPAILGEWQAKVGYIPCRIFKNISYGQMGITNSVRVYELFEGKVVYNPDTYQLFYDARKRLETFSLDEQHDLMDFVKNKHTYLNRVQTMLDFLKLLGYDD